MKVEVNDEALDQLMADVLLDSIDGVYGEIQDLKHRKNSGIQKENLKELKQYLKALKTVYKWYTVSSKWAVLEKYK